MAGPTQAAGSFKRILNPFNNSGQQPESSSHIRQNKPDTKCGWLFKQGGVIKSWHRRWFVVKGDQLHYFSTRDESKQMGIIYLPGNRVVEMPLNPAEPDRFPFEIQPGVDKSRMTLTHETYPLQAASEDERKYWIQAIKKIMYGANGGAIFGQSLNETMVFEAKTSSRKVPRIIETCVEFLLKDGVETEGIFRLPGRSVLIKQLKEVFDCGESVEFTIPDVDVHTVASLLKLYLRELPEPVVPRQFYEPVMKIVQRDLHVAPEKAMNSLQALLTHMPRNNYNLLQYLTHFLYEVSNKSEVNKMTAMNLATVFVHSVIRPEDEDPALLMGTANGRTQVTYIFITEWEKLFKMEYNAQGAAVKVGTLLDIGASSMESGKVFKSDTSTPVVESKSAGDLFDLAVSTDQTEVPKPCLVPAVSETTSSALGDRLPVSLGENDFSSVDGDQSKPTDVSCTVPYTAINDLDPYNPSVQHDSGDNVDAKVASFPAPDKLSRPLPVRAAPLPPRSSSSDDVASAPAKNEQNSTPPKVLMRSRSGSIPKPRPRKYSETLLSVDGGDAQAVENAKESPPSRRSAEAKPLPLPKPRSGSSGSGAAERPTPVRPAPPPPSQPQQGDPTEETNASNKARTDQLHSACATQLNNNTSKLETQDGTGTIGTNQNVSDLLSTDTVNFSNAELQQFVSKLKAELLRQRKAAQEEHSSLVSKHKQQLQEMARKLDGEKIATAEAVQKIVALQNQLQSYNLKFGVLD